jgi:hypothetical protein
MPKFGPLTTKCPFCGQMVKLRYNGSGRRHALAHVFDSSRKLYESYRFLQHAVGDALCTGSNAQPDFNPRPQEGQHFNLPRTLVDV